MTQSEVVLEHLRSHTGLNTFEAVETYGITRLSAVIFQLKEAGYSIVSIPRKLTNPRGQKVRSCEYRLSTYKEKMKEQEMVSTEETKKAKEKKK